MTLKTVKKYLKSVERAHHSFHAGCGSSAEYTKSRQKLIKSIKKLAIESAVIGVFSR